MNQHWVELWIARDPFPVPDPPVVAPPGLGPLGDTFIGWLKWGAIYGGMGGLLICAIMIQIGRRRSNAMASDGLSGSTAVLGGLALASCVALIVGVFRI